MATGAIGSARNGMIKNCVLPVGGNMAARTITQIMIWRRHIRVAGFTSCCCTLVISARVTSFAICYRMCALKREEGMFIARTARGERHSHWVKRLIVCTR